MGAAAKGATCTQNHREATSQDTCNSHRCKNSENLRFPSTFPCSSHLTMSVGDQGRTVFSKQCYKLWAAEIQKTWDLKMLPHPASRQTPAIPNQSPAHPRLQEGLRTAKSSKKNLICGPNRHLDGIFPGLIFHCRWGNI